MAKREPVSPDLVDDERFADMRAHVQGALLKAHHEGLPALCLVACLVGQIMLVLESMSEEAKAAGLYALLSTLDAEGMLDPSLKVPPGSVH